MSIINCESCYFIILFCCAGINCHQASQLQTTLATSQPGNQKKRKIRVPLKVNVGDSASPGNCDSCRGCCELCPIQYSFIVLPLWLGCRSILTLSFLKKESILKIESVCVLNLRRELVPQERNLKAKGFAFQSTS